MRNYAVGMYDIIPEPSKETDPCPVFSQSTRKHLREKFVFQGSQKNMRKKKSRRGCAFLVVMLDRRLVLWSQTSNAAWTFMEVSLDSLDHLLRSSSGTSDALARLVSRTQF